jgi:hypothetical protein
VSAVVDSRGVSPRKRDAGRRDDAGVQERAQDGTSALLAERDSWRLPADAQPGWDGRQTNRGVDVGMHDRVEHGDDGERHDPADR